MNDDYKILQNQLTFRAICDCADDFIWNYKLVNST